MNPGIKKVLTVLTAVLGVWFFVQFLLPLTLPFLLGGLLALAAEPIVSVLYRKFRLPRTLASGVGVSMAFFLLTLLVMLLCALLIRELQVLSGILPDLEDAMRSGMDSLSSWMTALARRMPGSLGALLSGQIADFFSGGAALLDKVMGYLLSLATGILSRVPDSALMLGTAILSSFMISAKLPKLRTFFHEKFPASRIRPILDTFSRLKSTLCGWLRAQAKLCGVTFLVTAAGLLLLRVEYGILWALVIAVVDAVPILGAGTALIPWSLVSFLQGDRILAFGLLGTYAAVAVIRSVLEPKLLGRQLGLDPLVTLAALYAGYRLWGFGGMIIAPMLAVLVSQVLKKEQ